MTIVIANWPRPTHATPPVDRLPLLGLRSLIGALGIPDWELLGVTAGVARETVPIGRGYWVRSARGFVLLVRLLRSGVCDVMGMPTRKSVVFDTTSMPTNRRKRFSLPVEQQCITDITTAGIPFHHLRDRILSSTLYLSHICIY
jgi:hypothetical protein